MRFRSSIDSRNSYFFLINAINDINAPGPVPVLFPPYGNGFATSSGGQDGFTDFVRFDNRQPQGYGLYHVIGNSNSLNFGNPQRPINFVFPDPNDPRTAVELRFEIDLSQLITDSLGNPLADQQEAANQASRLRYLQVNIVVTNIVPTDPNTLVDKQVDSFGDNTDLLTSGSAFLTIDLGENQTQFRTYTNRDGGTNLQEPEGDAFPGSSGLDPSIDLIDWSVEFRDFNRS